jgi:hypothetical protein
LKEVIIGKTSKMSPLQGLISFFNSLFTKMPALRALKRKFQNSFFLNFFGRNDFWQNPKNIAPTGLNVFL